MAENRLSIPPHTFQRAPQATIPQPLQNNIHTLLALPLRHECASTRNSLNGALNPRRRPIGQKPLLRLLLDVPHAIRARICVAPPRPRAQPLAQPRAELDGGRDIRRARGDVVGAALGPQVAAVGLPLDDAQDAGPVEVAALRPHPALADVDGAALQHVAGAAAGVHAAQDAAGQQLEDRGGQPAALDVDAGGREAPGCGIDAAG